ncbi:TRAP transporter substrate-binding protein [uncultured Cohaesibacter sp.]|uniref:TRAP transporter substrate-binding protein n=1 Tax=uncultured Cohaesibacter sp. TaxID=1002546 RepID=UPI0029C79F7B|nr:TRAP transporter substrate-binding protein [uncultured Cohaesibacter sp.]
MKTFIAAFVATSLLALTAAEARNLTLGHAMSTDNAQHQGMQIFADLVKEKSNGDLTVQIFPNAQLGSERDQAEQVITGALDMAKINGSLAESFEPTLKVMGLPFLFSDADHQRAFMHSDVAWDLMQESKGKGFIGLSLLDAGARSFYGHKPFYTPADLKGLKIRVPESKTSMRMIELLGGNATPMPWTEIYTGLQQGIMDAAENSISSLVEARHAEVAKHFSKDEHTMTPDIILISEATWNSLNADEQKILRDASLEALDKEIELWAANEAANVKKAEEIDVKFYDVDKQAFRDAVKPMIDEALNDPKLGDYVRRIQELD